MIPRRKVLPAQRQDCYALQHLSDSWQLTFPRVEPKVHLLAAAALIVLAEAGRAVEVDLTERVHAGHDADGGCQEEERARQRVGVEQDDSPLRTNNRRFRPESKSSQAKEAHHA